MPMLRPIVTLAAVQVDPHGIEPGNVGVTVPATVRDKKRPIPCRRISLHVIAYIGKATCQVATGNGFISVVKLAKASGIRTPKGAEKVGHAIQILSIRSF
jgi:hypothetical protein